MPDSPLTLEGLAEILRTHAERTDRRFQAVELQIERLTRRVDDLAGQTEGVVGILGDVGRLVTTLADQHVEHTDQARQILHRLEGHDDQFEQIYGRLEAQDSHIRCILDILESREGNGGPPCA
jgi:hypothetical protein